MTLSTRKLPTRKEDEVLNLGAGYTSKVWNEPDHKVVVIDLKDNRQFIWAEKDSKSSDEEIKQAIFYGLLREYAIK